ncbi:hypothetical protein D3C77_466040 [compost metagenome]
MLLVAVVLGIGQGHVVVQVPQHLARADLAFGITPAAQLVAHLQRRSVMAGMGDIVDGAAQGQGAAVKAVGTAQYFGAAQPQRLEQFVGGSTGAGQRQAVELGVDAGTVAARGAVDARATNRELDAVVTCRLGKYPWLVGQDILVAGDPALLHALHVDQVGGTRHVPQALTSVLQFTLFLFLDQYLTEFDAFAGLGRGGAGDQQGEGGAGEGGTHRMGFRAVSGYLTSQSSDEAQSPICASTPGKNKTPRRGGVFAVASLINRSVAGLHVGPCPAVAAGTRPARRRAVR